MQVAGPGTGVDCTASRADPAVGADTHAGHRAQAGATASAGATATANDQPQRDHAPAHCPMAMTCAPTALTAAAYAIDEPAVTSTLIVASDDVIPPSTGGAPEPPPPRT